MESNVLKKVVIVSMIPAIRCKYLNAHHQSIRFEIVEAIKIEIFIFLLLKSDYINSIITNCTSIIDDMYAEMPEKVDDFTGYRSLFELGPDLFHQNNHSESKTERLCDSERKYIRPSVFKDVRNEFHLILQSSFYLQQIPVEICS